MFRYRRYRAFLVFAVIAVLAIYRFGGSGAAWREAASHAVGAAHGLKGTVEEVLQDTKPRPAVAHETKSLKLHVPAASTSRSLQTPPPVKSLASSTPTPVVTKQKPSIPTPIRPNPHGNPAVADDTLESSAEIEVVHWTKLPEKFPVPTESLIRLPSGKPKAIPKIQAKFKKEDAAAKSDRLAKLARIQSVAKKSWDGYKAKAWLHDELRPESGTFRDPFANWGATLVDSLDTLWIMGLKEDFEEAARAVDKIDFTTTTRADVPLFETTIRYLGGLVAAYDLSEKKYKNLLDKAVELAEVLISAFDTPNRMPETYYYWRPDFASQKHRAGTRVVLAEIGSLSVEFTRLAQLTGEHKYYDAIARITDNLEEFQGKTQLPGMWPVYLDASGCGRRYADAGAQEPLTPPDGYLDDAASTESEAAKPTPTEELSPDGKKYVPLALPDPVRLYQESDAATTGKKYEPLNLPDPVRLYQESDAATTGKKYEPLNLPDPVRLYQDDDIVRPGAKEEWIKQGTAGKAQIKNWNNKPVEKRQLDVDISEPPKAGLNAESAARDPSSPTIKSDTPECIPQGFVSSSSYGSDEFTLGGMSDSTYEYLPKQYLLLGGQVEKYRTMYEQSMDAVKKHLLFRPMLPKGEDVLFSGKLIAPASADTSKAGDLTAENAHLTCFTGGMFGMGAKIFNRPEDLEIAKKLTEGCVWGYDMTQTGIMPESFEVAPCEDMKDCAWNETAYWDAIDPGWESRLEHYEQQRKIYGSQIASASSWYNAQLAAMTPTPTPVVGGPREAKSTSSLIYADTLEKRQLAELVDDSEIAHMSSASAKPTQNHDSVMGGESEEGEGPPTKVQPTLDIPEFAPQPSGTLPEFPYVYSPVAVLNHKDYVRTRIVEDRLPKGVTRIGARNYILRPEAIESVWYMYRITGDSHWRDAGWRMFLVIDQHTSTVYGNSAIDDVTKMAPELNDEMESFWLAETLKYFYLLFAEESVISLDEWVLNTEAHPFRRPT
ncbi:class I alpha-mannosidase 1A [Pyrenophora seminiperda CCB06]|uniref:alpha-1,2-Mannosidase n=1 Tax=Pyrenophora seminiperda CCB06 TaxID=1302712 RepID=A0A3M7M701_9PLEO|nr:class I alpha-mannosidase 1A [Pyrenophora seminiperda CCB06]